MFRTSLAITLVFLALGHTAAFDEKIDSKLLIGKWEPAKAPPGLKVVLEFMKENKMKIEVEVQGKQEKIEGTYKVEKDQFSMTLSKDGQERSQKAKIIKLSDKELVLKDENRNEEEVLKRVQ